MNNNCLFWYVRIIKTIDIYNLMNKENPIDKEKIESYLADKDINDYIKIFFIINNEYKKFLVEMNPKLNFYDESRG